MDVSSTIASAARYPLELRLFGRADVRVGGAPVKFAKRTTTLAMLAFLVLKRGHAVGRDSLAFVLFPDLEEPAALRELRRCLYLLIKVLPDRPDRPWLNVDAETIGWNDDADAFVDIVWFERLAADPQRHAAAIELYAGDLLEDVYDDWILAERERLRSRYLAILSESVDRHRAAREYLPAIACAKRLLTTDPWREDAVRSLIAMRYESGDTAGALAEYTTFAKRLRDELGIAPMPETVAVRQSILRNDAVPGSFNRPSPEAAPGPPLAVLPFVGRDREFAALRGAWSRAAHGAGALTLISGEAGVGKTRLATELARTVQAEGGRVFVGTTAAPESTPYQALTEALRSALPLLLARPPAAARRTVLARILPELRDPEAPGAAGSEPAAERETARIFDALAHAIRGLASPRPLLLILEDLQWAGSAGIEALGAIVRDLTSAPVLIVATTREEETPVNHPLRAMLRSLRAARNVEEIALERLGEADVAAIVTRVDGLHDRGPDLARRLYAHSEGNALFLNEAIGVTLERAGTPDGTAGTSVETLIAARMRQLGSDARTVADIASVAGAGCSVPLIRDVSNLSAAAVARGFDELLDRRLLREAGARSKLDYVFTHHLIAEAVYREIEPAFRAQRHARIARVLEAGYDAAGDASSREIARHYERGGDAERAAGWYLTAAQQSAAVYAYGDAIELATRGLALPAPSDVRAALLGIRETAYGRRGERICQRDDIDALDALAGDDPAQRFEVIARRIEFTRTLGESDAEGRLIGELQEVAERLGDAARARALVQRATHAGLRSRAAEGIGHARAALDVFERLADVRGQLDCLFLLVDYATNVGDIGAARIYLAQMHERASTLADRAVEARALAVASTAALLRAEYRECFELSSRGLALNLATGDREAEAMTRGRMAVTAAWLADFGTSLREFDRALQTYESIGHKRGIALTYTNRTVLLMRLGMFEEALHSIERSNDYFNTVHEQRTIVANQVNASFVHIQLGHADTAKALAESALAAAREIGFPLFEAAALSNVGNAERILGNPPAAIAHMTAGITLRRPLQEARDFVDDLADLTLAYVAAGRVAEAVATARELEVVGAVSFDGAMWPHYAWWAIARGLEAGGDANGATAAAERAKSELTRFAARIDDGAARRAFLSIPVNVRILGA